MCVDKEKKIVTSPAYMYTSPIHIVHESIDNMIQEVLDLASIVCSDNCTMGIVFSICELLVYRRCDLQSVVDDISLFPPVPYCEYSASCVMIRHGERDERRMLSQIWGVCLGHGCSSFVYREVCER